MIEKLLENQELETKYKDHALTGNWNGYRDCHIEPDWILIYKISESYLFLVRSGSHSDLCFSDRRSCRLLPRNKTQQITRQLLAKLRIRCHRGRGYNRFIRFACL